MWARSSYDEYRGLGDYYRPGLGVGVAAGHGHEGAGGGTTNPYTAPPSSLAQAGLEDRQHEDTKSGVLWSSADKGGGGGVPQWSQEQLAQWQLYSGTLLHHDWMAAGLDASLASKMQLENGDLGGYGRPQSSTSLSPPSSGLGLVAPQPINPRLPNNMIGGLGVNGRKYPCKMCPQAFNSKADLQLHTQIHLREPKPYKCANCGKAFANSSYLSQHTRIHLGIKPYRCEICQRKFTQLSHLQQHIRTHTGDKPYKCRIPGCTKAFSQLSNLQSHSRCHQTDKPHKCQSCYKCFADEAALLEHIPKHKESKHVKTHICAYCGKSYTQESYLAKHMQKHSDRMDKRAPINCGPGNGLTGLGPADYWGKMDIAALYPGYGGQLGGAGGVVDHSSRLPEIPGGDTRDPGGYNWDHGTRNSSAFSPLQPAVTHSNTSVATEVSKAAAVYDSLQFPKQNGQDVKSGAGLNIPLTQLRSYVSDKQQMSGAETK